MGKKEGAACGVGWRRGRGPPARPYHAAAGRRHVGAGAEVVPFDLLKLKVEDHLEPLHAHLMMEKIECMGSWKCSSVL